MPGAECFAAEVDYVDTIERTTTTHHGAQNSRAPVTTTRSTHQSDPYRGADMAGDCDELLENPGFKRGQVVE